MAKANSIGYCHIMKRLPEGFRTFPEEKIHTCSESNRENNKRYKDKEQRIFIFVDFETHKYNMRIGLEFVQVNYCPFCGTKL